MRTKTEARRREILNVATATFTELGVESTTLSEIVARMGGSKSTIYSYFPSKADLVEAVLAHASELKLQQAFRGLEPGQPLDGALRQFGRTYMTQLLSPEMLSAIRIAQQDGARSDNGRRYYDSGPRVGWGIMARYLEERMAHGELLRADSWAAAMHLKGLLQAEWLDRSLLGETIPAPDAIERAAELAVDVFLRAYRAG
jgi:AcrR family transcriptional regulator